MNYKHKIKWQDSKPGNFVISDWFSDHILEGKDDKGNKYQAHVLSGIKLGTYLFLDIRKINREEILNRI
ncbi:MAG: hypothetical protein ACNS62_20810 [Candidatus Cyclobacteriaceae bacterium M3_2C_046]